MTDLRERIKESRETIEHIAIGYALNYASVYPSSDNEMLVAEKTDFAMKNIEALINQEVREAIGKLPVQETDKAYTKRENSWVWKEDIDQLLEDYK